MRLWSIHPQYLDAVGLVALWREGLLAQKVLVGKTKGYKNHPQLERFKKHKDPLKAISFYLYEVFKEAFKRGYSFNKDKIMTMGHALGKSAMITRGQLDYEFGHLLAKLEVRDPARFEANRTVTKILEHPLFRPTQGGVADWERTWPGR